VINSCTSIFGGVCIFSVLGYMAHEMGLPIEEVTAGGPGLIFIAYPKAISLMPTLTTVLSIMFFLMIIFLGLDSQFVGVEGFTSQFMDAFPHFFNFKHSRAVFITLVSVAYFFTGLIMVTEGGMYIFQIMDFYAASGIVLLFVCFCETAGVAYFYGSKRYTKDIEYMIGRSVPSYFTISWMIFTPLTLMLIAVIFLINITPLQYKEYVYPKWTQILGWGITSVTCLTIPVTMFIQCITSGDNIDALKTAVYKSHQVHAKTQHPYVVKRSSNEDTNTATVPITELSLQEV